MRGVWLVLKIHIVRKGDTLWEIAKQYGVDFEELQKSNPQLSSPDMIMPGMKIKIPSGSKTVKKETTIAKETKVPVAKKETPKQAPTIKEDDHEKPKEVKVEMPKKHTPAIPSKLQTPKKEAPIVKEQQKSPTKPTKEIQKAPVKPMKEMIKMPVMEELPIEQPKVPQAKKPKKNIKVDEQSPVAPICYHYYHHCCPPLFQHCFPVMNEMTGGFMPHHHMQQGHMIQPLPIQPQQMGQPCGCHVTNQHMQQYQMREQLPMPEVNFAPPVHQPYGYEPQVQPVPEAQLYSIEKPFPFPPPYPSFSEDSTREVEQTDKTDENQ